MQKETSDLLIRVRNEKNPPEEREGWFSTQEAALDRAKKRGLGAVTVYSTLSFVAGSSGSSTYRTIADLTKQSIEELLNTIALLRDEGLLEEQLATDSEPTTLILLYVND